MLNISLFLILCKVLDEFSKIKNTQNLFQETNKIPLQLAQIMSDYVENIYSTSNKNILMNNFDFNKIEDRFSIISFEPKYCGSLLKSRRNCF